MTDTRVSGAEHWLTLNNVALSFGEDTDNRDAGATEYKDNIFRIAERAPDHLRIFVDGEELETEVYGRWLWRPRGFAGVYRITLNASGAIVGQARVRVLPSKLSYARYAQMLKDISRFSVDLLFRLRSPAGEYVRPEYSEERSSALREYALLQRILPELSAVVAAIRRSPHTELRSCAEQHVLDEALRFGETATPCMADMVAIPTGAGRKRFQVAKLPAVWQVEHMRLTYDVAENRLLKHFLRRQLIPRIFGIHTQATTELQRRSLQRDIKRRRNWEDDETEHIDELERVVAACAKMYTEVIAWLDAPFLHMVAEQSFSPTPTQILQKHPHYARFYRIYLDFQQSLRYCLNTSIFLTTLSLRNMAELYEIWSVFRMTEFVRELLVSAGYTLVTASGFFSLIDDQLQFEVNRNSSIELTRGDNRVVIRYEPLYFPEGAVVSGLVSANARSQRTPDMAIELWSGPAVRQVLLFDAKYRTTKLLDRETYVEDDLDKMDQYRRTIQWKPPSSSQMKRKVVASAYIIYPGDELEHDEVRCDVGALPLKPLQEEVRGIAGAVLDLLRNAKMI